MKSEAHPNTRRYVVVSPVRNEVQHLCRTLRSMVDQTVCPAQWVLVNDGSSDGTAELIEHWASQYPWILLVNRPDRGHGTSDNWTSAGTAETRAGRGKRARAAKEIEAFYAGYAQIASTEWEFLVKLDGDVGFERDYFEKCFEEFDADPKLGIGGGAVYDLVSGGLRIEPNPHFHARGATKIYRRACWEEIGGVIRAAGWDTLDEVKANMLGWTTRSFSRLKVVHYRPTGAANGAWHNATKNGLWSYIAGYHPLYMLARCARRALKKPYLVASMGLLVGFLQGYFQRVPRNGDERLVRYVREQQLRRLTLRTTIWK